MAQYNNPEDAQQPTEFETRRAELVGQIGDSLEQVLTQINALNRSLESIIEIGNEFASVEALWSQFENVMASNQTQTQNQNPAQDQTRGQDEGGEGDGNGAGGVETR